MLGLKQIHHIAIIATDYAKSKAFYCDILGLRLLSEVYREERDSWKGDLALNGQYVIELFSFPFLALRAFLVGITKTKALNVAALTAVLVNIPCNWLLIFRKRAF